MINPFRSARFPSSPFPPGLFTPMCLLHRHNVFLSLIFGFLITFLGSFILTTSTHAATPSALLTDYKSKNKIIEEFSTLLDDAEKQIAREQSAPDDPMGSERLSVLRRDLLSAIQDLSLLSEELRVDHRRISKEVSALGPAPTPPDAESDTISELRKILNNQILFIDSEKKSIQFIQFRGQTLAQRIVDIQITRLTNQLFSRNTAPLSHDVWRAALEDWLQIEIIASQETSSLAKGMWSDQERETITNVILLSVLVFFLLSWPIQHGLTRRFLRAYASDTPYTLQERIWIAAQRSAIGIVSLLPFIIIASGANIFINETQLLSPRQESLVLICTLAFISTIVSIKIAAVILAPRLPDMRAVPFETHTAKHVFELGTFLLAVSAGDLVVPFIEKDWGLSVESVSLRMFVSSIAVILPLLLLTRAPLWHRQEDGTLDADTAKKTRWLRWSAAIPITAALVAALSGYTELSHYLATALVRTLGLAATALVLFAILREILGICLQKIGAMTPDDETKDLVDSSTMRLFWLNILIGVLAGVPSFLIVLALWGVSWDTIRSGLSLLADGFAIGTVHIAPTNVFAAILVFAALVFLTNALKAVLENRVLPMTRLDPGLKNSFATSVGYVGFVIAILVATSTLGISLSNLAIVAGALSVGIGFGLQNIVNNFVSGLILLFERPIKSGDWIVTEGTEGYVRRIRVRATEIETFDRSTVIIPNSALITSPVTNWFLHNRIGRCIIEIGVSYDSDPEKVHDILLECAQAHPRVLRWPEPVAYLMNFADSALVFSLRFQIQDIEYVNPTSSDVRMAILKAFQEAGISIPFPQRDIRLIPALATTSHEEKPETTHESPSFWNTL